MKRSVYDISILSLFCVGLLLPLLGLGNRERSNVENRALVQRPALPDSPWQVVEFLQRWSLYLEDQYGFREEAYLANNRLRRWLGFRAHDAVVEGKDGWLYFVGGEKDRPLEDVTGLNLWTQEELERWANALSERSEWLEARGVAYLFVVAPNKAAIYPEYLPNEYARWEGPSRAQQLADFLSRKANAPFRYLREELLAAKPMEEGRTTFGKKGTHWNAFGAAMGYNAIGLWLEERLPGAEFVPFGASDFEWTETAVDRDLERMLFGEADGLGVGPVLRRAMDELNWDTYHRLQRTPQGEWDYDVYALGVESGPVALVFGDSFFVGLAPYLSEAVGTVILANDRPTAAEVREAVRRFEPDLVIEQRVERNLWEIPGE